MRVRPISKPNASSGGRVEGATVIGIGLMLTAIVLFCCLNGAVKWLTQTHDPLMAAWARNVGAVVFMLAAFLPRYGFRLVLPRRPWAQIGRGMMLLGATVLYFSGLSKMGMATGAAIQLTGPLMVTALSGPLLGEHIGWRRWMAVGFGFVGALIIIRPGFDMRWAALLFVASAMCSTLYQISTRYLAGTDSAATAATVAAIVGAVALSPVAPFVWDRPDGWLTIALFASIGLLAGLGHFLLTNAYRYAGAATLAPINYGQIVGAAIVGFIVFGDFPDRWTLVGAAIIVGAGLYVTQRERVASGRGTVSSDGGTR